MYARCLNLTKKLVSIPSVNATSGEAEIGNYILEYVKSIPYFKEHPNQVWGLPLKDDPLHRLNVFALLKGEGGDSKDTIMLHGHTDTVPVEDYGELAQYAFDCEKLEEELKKRADMLPEEVRKDLDSGDYLFGRGASDMKGGDAVHIVVMEELCKRVKEINGNILLSLNPVEETLHKGILDGLDFLYELKEKEGLNFLFAINNDFICGMYPGDETRYVYTGSVGKLLPCFYVRGKETHVGQAFEGFDCCMAAGEIVRSMQLNCRYCDNYHGEIPAPPTALRMRDLKKTYSVQTPFSSFVYMNYMVHNKNVGEILAEIKEVAQRALDSVTVHMNENYKEYCKLIGAEYQEIKYQTQVLEYRELYQRAEKNYAGELSALVEKLTRESMEAEDDKRDTALKIVESLCDIADIKIPTVIVFFATPHCPHNTMKEEVPEERALTAEIQKILDEFSKESGEKFQIMHFFPSLTDSSYLKIDDSEKDIAALHENFPRQDLLYPVPYDKIRSLNIPGLNYGTFGRDAHKWTERVKKSYSFGQLPRLIIKTVEFYMMR